MYYEMLNVKNLYKVTNIRFYLIEGRDLNIICFPYSRRKKHHQCYVGSNLHNIRNKYHYTRKQIIPSCYDLLVKLHIIKNEKRTSSEMVHISQLG